MMEQADELNFALDGFLPWRPVRIQRSSLLTLLTICGSDEGRRLIKEREMADMIVDAILDLNFDDSVISIGAAALLYTLAGDVEDDTLLDSPSCVRFLLRLLSPIKGVKKNYMNIDSNHFEVHEPRIPNNANNEVDSMSRAIISKVKELLSSCNEIKSCSNDDDEIKRPEFCSKWIALLIMEKACLSSVSFEDTSDKTGKVWGNFKESFRELKGLDAIFDVVVDCHSTLEGWFKKKSVSVSALNDGDSASLESVLLLLKSMKILENATFMSENNQNYLLKMNANSDSRGVPLSFVGTIISCITFLSGLSLLQSISRISDNENSSFCASGACAKGKITEVQDYSSTACFSATNSQLEKIEACYKRHKRHSSNLEASTSDCVDRTDCFASTLYNTTLHLSKEVSFRNTQRASNGWVPRSFIDSKVCSREQFKRSSISYHVNDAHNDPFAFDEDNSGSTRWEQFSSKNGRSQARKQSSRGKDYDDKSEIPLLIIDDDELSQPIIEVDIQSRDHSCPSVGEKDPSLLENCLLTSVKVLMNLTNDNPVGCRQIGACGGLDTLASLIASHFSSFDLCTPFDFEIEENAASVNRSNISGLNDRRLCDHELDFLVAILGLLVNLVEKDSLNRLRLASARVLVSRPGASASKEIYRDVVPLLCSIFMSNQGTGNATEEDEDDEASLLQSQREAEMMIIEAYTALLLAFLSTESTAVKEAIARCLPNHRLEILVPVLERFAAFHLTLKVISPETHSAVVKVIESCKEP